MIADPFALAGAAVATALLALSLKPFGGGLAQRTALTGGIIILAAAAGELGGIFARIRGLAGQASGLAEAAGLALRVTGIAYVAQTAADLCRDCGEEGLASKAELTGRLMMLSASLGQIVKLVEKLISLAEELL